MENNITFKLTKGEYIQLNDLLKVTGLVGTGGEAKLRILDDEVKVNGVLEKAIRKKIKVADKVYYAGFVITVE
jgi:ribosome-associated protein